MAPPFETYFSLAEIAQRIPKSDQFWRAEVKRRAFAGVVSIGGEYFVPASSVAAYLEARGLGVAPLAAMVNGRTRQPDTPAPPVLSAGVRARSPGELRRKVVQTSGREENSHG